MMTIAEYEYKVESIRSGALSYRNSRNELLFGGDTLGIANLIADFARMARYDTLNNLWASFNRQAFPKH